MGGWRRGGRVGIHLHPVPRSEPTVGTEVKTPQGSQVTPLQTPCGGGL